MFFGGAIFNIDSIGDIAGDFIGNYAKSSHTARGGAVYMKYYAYSGSITSYDEATLGNITGDFIQNKAEGTVAQGGAVDNNGSIINSITGNFYLNEARATSTAAFGGAISNGTSGGFSISYPSSVSGLESNIRNIKGDFVQNSVYGVTVAAGGAIYNSEDTVWCQYGVGFIPAKVNASGAFIENKAIAETGNAYGGAIYNHGDMTLTNVSLIDNYAEAGTNGEAKGGGIYSDKSFTLAADGGTSLIQGNYVIDNNGNIENNGIYMDQYVTSCTGNYTNMANEHVTQIRNSTLTLSAKNNGQIIINDKINGIGALEMNYVTDNKGDEPIRYVEYISAGGVWGDVEKPTEFKNYGVKFTGDGTGAIVLNNNIEAEDFVYDDGTIETGRADVTLDGANLYLATRADVLDGNNVSFNSGSFNMINDSVGVTHFNEFQINGDTSFTADVDLKNAEMDRITADNYGTNSGNLIVNGMNLIAISL